MKLPVYKCTVGDLDKKTGIFAVSFVSDPAIEADFIALAKERKRVELSVNSAKRLLTGPLLIPDKLIYRYDDVTGEEYYIKFTAQDIEKIALKMMRDSIALKTTTHEHERSLSNNYLFETWIIEDPKRDKSVALGMPEFPKGTLMVTFKVQDPAYWIGQVANGKVKGFSLEGLFNFNSVNMNKEKKTPDKKGDGKAKKSFLRKMVEAVLELESTAEEAAGIADEAKKDETDSGTPYLIFELAEGGEVYVDSEGFCTLDGEQMSAGTHALSDGNFLQVDDNGVMIDTTDTAEEVEPEQAVEAAKDRAKKYLAAKAAKKGDLAKKADLNAQKIEALTKQLENTKAEIAKLRATPSGDKATPSAVDKDDARERGKAWTEMSVAERAAVGLTARLNRQDRKKSDE